ncbi:3-deoxy-7-phosphoheptulonate synthase [bacterium]|nr:3-deoxy-7-phosphoheptulonate synthase [bacterium]
MTNLSQLINTNIAGSEELASPDEVKKLLPASETVLSNVLAARKTLEDILLGKDKRIFIVTGPCSIHDTKAALEYAGRLKSLSDKVKDKIFIIMRVYFEKPRTTVGWKGLINDPHMDDSFHIEKGIKIARELLLKIAELGLPSGTEALDPVTPQYLAELITWSAIGARTTESQTHREMASGLSMPVGFKNGTDGGITVALNAMKSALSSHHFLGINSEGKISKFSTKGNKLCHIVLRGGGGKPNYNEESIAACLAGLAKEKLLPKIVVDCSHENSNKDHKLQPDVLKEGIRQIAAGQKAICGFMIESHLNEGNQPIPENLKDLKYGVSVTDKCVNWETTETMILDAYSKL